MLRKAIRRFFLLVADFAPKAPARPKFKDPTGVFSR